MCDIYNFSNSVELTPQNFILSDLALLNSKDRVRPLKEYINVDVMEKHLTSTPVEGDLVVMLDDLSLRPNQLLKLVSELNKEYNTRVYAIRKYNKKTHANTLARFEDPAFQHVFAGLYIYDKQEMQDLLDNVRHEQEVDPDIVVLTINQNIINTNYKYGKKRRNRNVETMQAVKRLVEEEGRT